MSIYGEFKTATISSGNETSSAVDIGREYDYIDIVVPSMQDCLLSVQVSETTGGTYYDLNDAEGSAYESSQPERADVWALGGYRFIKIKASESLAATATFRVRGTRA